MSFSLLVKLLLGVFFDLFVGALTGASLIFAVGFGILEVLFLEVLCPSLGFWEVQAVGVLVDETEHAIAAAIDYETESDKEREAQARTLAREHPNNVYLFGDFSLNDAALLGVSAYAVSNTELPAAVFEVGQGLLELLLL